MNATADSTSGSMKSSEPRSPVPARRRWWKAVAGLLATTMLGLGVAACGKLLTTAPEAGDLFDSPLDGLTAAELAAFQEGDVQFGRAFSIADGLGPIFNNVSCASCHSGDGRGRPENVLTRFSVGYDPAYAMGGPQLQDKAIPGAEAEYLPAGVAWSKRLPPPVFGMGLIEAIPDATILANADPTDIDGNGISGRPNYVSLPPYMEPLPDPVVGRFSRKAQVSSILEQTVAAYHQDIGITSDFLTDENTNPLASVATEASDRSADPELSAASVRAVVAYLRTLAPPTPGPMNATRERGREVFGAIGCVSCHLPTLRTGPSTIRALADRDVTLYSDLLLHDMGDGLADGRPDGQADGREWRTAPLWGLRIMREFLRGQAFLLHDGRARTVAEAIDAHGGEALTARDAYRALSASDRAALLDFVESR